MSRNNFNYSTTVQYLLPIVGKFNPPSTNAWFDEMYYNTGTVNIEKKMIVIPNLDVLLHQHNP